MMTSDVPVSSTERRKLSRKSRRNRMKLRNLTLLVCVSQIDAKSKPDHHNLYYKIELEDNKMENLVIEKSENRGASKKQITVPFTKSSPKCHAWSGSAVCNSKIYSIGGNLDCLDVSSESQNEVFIYEISNTTTTTSWRKSVELKSRRHSPVAITIKDNVFIFGTVAYPSGNLTPWAEVLNTKSNTIEALHSQPHKSSIGAGFILCSAVVHQTTSQTKIVLATSDHCYIGPSRLLYYLVEKGCWEDVTRLHSNFFSGGPELDVRPELSVRSAVIDGVLYTYHNKKVYAYDLDYQKWFLQPLHGLLEEVECYYHYDSNTGFIINLGSDRLCVGFFSSFPHGEDKTAKLLFHYATFSPHIEGGLKKDRAHRNVTSRVYSKGYCVLRGMHFVDAMIMNPSF